MTDNKEGAKPMQLEVQMDEATAQGTYANLAGVTHSETEFIFDFLFLQPNQPKAKLRSRIISTLRSFLKKEEFLEVEFADGARTSTGFAHADQQKFACPSQTTCNRNTLTLVTSIRVWSAPRARW